MATVKSIYRVFLGTQEQEVSYENGQRPTVGQLLTALGVANGSTVTNEEGQTLSTGDLAPPIIHVTPKKSSQA